MKYIALFCCLLAVTKVHAQTNTRPPLFTLPLPPEIKDSSILFRLRAPSAKSVTVAFDGKVTPMQKDAKGIWSVSVQPVAPDIYAYNFIVDSFTVTDPSNPLLKAGYNGNSQSLIVMPGNPAASWELQDVPHGAVTRHLYKSAIIGDRRDYYVYTPPGYNAARKETYPVLFLLHGIGDDARAWTQTGFSNIILDNLIAQGKAVPMIMVYTLGYGDATSMIGEGSFEKYTQALLEEVMPAVKNQYHISAESSKHAIAGLSMGGAEALYAGLNHTDHFAWIGGFSSAFIMYRATGRAGKPAVNNGDKITDETIYNYNFPLLDKVVNSKIKLCWIACGSADFLRFSNKDFISWLSKKDITYQYTETPGAHTWIVWRRNLEAFAQLLFR